MCGCKSKVKKLSANKVAPKPSPKTQANPNKTPQK
jgi:hypothetical protein